MKKLIAGGAFGVFGALVLASVALAASHNPKGEYAEFNECPLSRATITDCVHSLTGVGSFTIGNKTVRVKSPVTLQGGYEGSSPHVRFFGAENGETLSRTPQPVPGALLGVTPPSSWPQFLQESFEEQIEGGDTEVTATVELAGPSEGLTNVKLNTENLIFQEGTALGLPVKFHLENSMLGSNCYIGSDEDPVQIDFTAASSGDLKGAAGEFKFNEPLDTVITISGGKLVNNTFAAPAAEGCGGIYSFLVDPLVNSVLGLPAAPGKSSAILEGTLKDGQSGAVKGSE
jgi:hypothetical protein